MSGLGSKPFTNTRTPGERAADRQKAYEERTGLPLGHEVRVATKPPSMNEMLTRGQVIGELQSNISVRKSTDNSLHVAVGPNAELQFTIYPDALEEVSEGKPTAAGAETVGGTAQRGAHVASAAEAATVDLTQNRDTVVAAVKEMTNTAALRMLAIEEQKRDKPRQTVLVAITNRVTELDANAAPPADDADEV
jgi:hypothetical protein